LPRLFANAAAFIVGAGRLAAAASLSPLNINVARFDVFPSNRQRIISSSPSARRIATSADESHPLNSAAPLATILNDVFTFSVGGAFLKLHCLFAYNAVQENYQQAFIVVQ
jgi:hypothetical protein